VNRISQTLEQLHSKGKKALVTYIVSGDPKPESTVDAMHALVSGGADIIELGVPFSDPMAEGPVIQKAHERALAERTTLRKTLDAVAAFRQRDTDTPVVLMGYANPVEKMGYELFSDSAKKAGVDGLLTVDLPPEEAEALDGFLQKNQLENIFLIAPTTSKDRIESVCKVARGFVYYVSFKGVTGAGHLDASAVAENVAEIKKVAHTPVLVGFGIKDAASAKAIGAVSDGVVVGSALVNLMHANAGDTKKMNKELESLVRSMRNALDEL